MPEQVEFTLGADSASTETHCNDPRRGFRLRQGYLDAHGGMPKQWKRIPRGDVDAVGKGKEDSVELDEREIDDHPNGESRDRGACVAEHVHLPNGK